MNDPQAQYEAKRPARIRMFKSFEEAAATEAADNAGQSPIERIRETVQLILRVYGLDQQQLNLRAKKYPINIISYDNDQY